LPAGSQIAVHGPLGNGWPQLPKDGRPLLLVAGGIGIAALAGVIFARPTGTETGLSLLYGAGSKDELVLLEDLCRVGGRGLRLSTITDDGSCGRRGLVTELLAEELTKRPAARVFACGPAPMLKGVQVILREREVPGWLSLENRMACGFGVCLGCVQKMSGGKRVKVCTEGPVLAAGEVVLDG
jgi:dihydroorotate dehydrogenase electron transfer subunit